MFLPRSLYDIKIKKYISTEIEEISNIQGVENEVSTFTKFHTKNLSIFL